MADASPITTILKSIQSLASYSGFVKVISTTNGQIILETHGGPFNAKYSVSDPAAVVLQQIDGSKNGRIAIPLGDILTAFADNDDLIFYVR